MSKIQIEQLYEQRGKLELQAQEILMRDAQTQAIDMAQVDNIFAQVDKISELIKRQEQDAEVRAQQIVINGQTKTTEEQRNLNYKKMFNQMLLNSMGVTIGTNEKRSAASVVTGLHDGINEHEVRANMTTSGGSGGFTIDSVVAPQLTEALKYYGGMRQKATVFETATGGDFKPPIIDTTSRLASIKTEGAAAGQSDVVFGTPPTLKAYMVSADQMILTYQLLQDSAYDLEGYVMKWLNQSISRRTNLLFTTGTGSGQPTGILAATGGAATGVTGATGQTTSVTFDNLVDLIHSVDLSYRDMASVGFMMHDKTFAQIKKLKATTGELLYVPSMSSAAPSTVLGYDVIINNDMPQMAANAKSIAFGDWSSYLIRDVMSVQLIRMVERYAEFAQVGYIAHWRGDGVYVNAGTNPIQLYVNSAT